MIRLELLLAGRILRVSCGPWWRWGGCVCAGTLLLDCGPVALVCYTRKMWWERP